MSIHCDSNPKNWTRELSPALVAAVLVFSFLALAAIVQILQPSLVSGEWMMRAAIFAVTYMLLYALIFSTTPWVTASCWLAIPVLLFVATWLRSIWSIPLVALIFWSLVASIRENRERISAGWCDALPGALLILFWVSMAGAGGYGFQNSDYVLHNGRLIDLVENAWPVSYQHGIVLTRPEHADRNLFVLYSGYYLLAGWLGKLSNLSIAMEFMHVWTVGGCWIALRFLQSFSQMRNAVLPALLLIFCGGWDLFGVLGSYFLRGYIESSNQLAAGLQQLWQLGHTPVWLDFWAGDVLVDEYHFGNFLSLTAELFWAPHHTIASWLSVGLIYVAWKKSSYKFVVFNAALLMFFSPLMCAVLAVFVLAMALQGGIVHWRFWISMPNAVGFMVAVIFALYYWSGSAAANPVGLTPLKSFWPAFGYFLYFWFFSWGIYALSCRKHIALMSNEKKIFFSAVFFIFAMFSLFRYGLWNDLMVRSSAPLYFCIAILLLEVVKTEMVSRKYIKAVLFVVLVVPSAPSAILNLHTSMTYLGHKEPAKRVVDYWDGWEGLGTVNSFYAKYLAAPPGTFFQTESTFETKNPTK